MTTIEFSSHEIIHKYQGMEFGSSASDSETDGVSDGPSERF